MNPIWQKRQEAVKALLASHDALAKATPKSFVIGELDLTAEHAAHDRAWEAFALADRAWSAHCFPENYPELQVTQ